MRKIFVDCEMNAECVEWLKALIGEKGGSQRVAESLLLVIRNALEGKLKEKISHEKVRDLRLTELAKSLKQSIVRDLNTLRVNNHGTDFPKTFLKVIWHQLEENCTSSGPGDTIKLPGVTPFQEQTILSSYVKDVHLEIIENNKMDSDVKWENSDSLNDMVDKILLGTNLDYSDHRKVTEPGKLGNNEMLFETHFYTNLEEKRANLDLCLSQEFDDIELSDTEGGIENTLFEGMIAKLPLKLENLKDVKVSMLPSKNFDQWWESLHYDYDLKEKMYAHATLSLQVSQLLSKSKHTIRKNNLFLLHGPPGTGKTTLCKALCQKIASRNWDLFGSGHSVTLVEASCSHIFSRWFGESTKNLDGIFSDIEQLLKHQQASKKFVCLLFDEVESLAFSRNQLLNTNETTDSVRVLNCLMTHLDNLKKYPNFILLCTSNLIDKIDPAFVDRLDVLFHVDFPSAAVCQEILTNITQELIDANIVSLDQNYIEWKSTIEKLAFFSSVCCNFFQFPLSATQHRTHVLTAISAFNAECYRKVRSAEEVYQNFP